MCNKNDTKKEKNLKYLQIYFNHFNFITLGPRLALVVLRVVRDVAHFTHRADPAHCADPPQVDGLVLTQSLSLQSS